MTSNLSAFGYAPGDYWCKCRDCLTQFIGEKRAWRCMACAEKAAALPTPPASHDVGEAVSRLRAKAQNEATSIALNRMLTERDQTIDTLTAEVSRLRAEMVDTRNALADAIAKWNTRAQRPALTDEQVRDIAERHAAEFKKRTEIEIGAAWFVDAIREAIGRGNP